MTLVPRGLLGLLLAACLLALAAPSAHAARGMEIAVQDDEQFLSDHADIRAAAFGHARSLGVSALRTNVSWSRIVGTPASRTAPAQPIYDFTRVDRLVDEAAASGMRVQLTLAGPAPAWATGNHRIGVDRISPKRFAEFAAVAARHFNGRVRAVSVWNEPNWHGLLKTERICGKVTKRVKGKGKKGKRNVHKRVCVKTSARRYRDMYRAAYSAIKHAAPGMPVWIGETNPYVNKRKQSTAPLAWLRQMLCIDRVVKKCRGGALRADGYAHHPYDFARAPGKKRKSPDEVTLANVGKLSKFLSKNRKRLKVKRNSLYLTEFAYYSSGPNAQPEKRRSKWTKQAFAVALKAANVRQLLYYQLVDPAKTRVFRTGLVTLTGAKHPVFKALQSFYAARKSKLTRPRAPFVLPPPPFG
jgi:hypothetical protein